MRSLNDDEIDVLMACSSVEELQLKIDVLKPNCPLTCDDLVYFIEQLSVMPEFSFVLKQMVERGLFGESLYDYIFGIDYYIAKSFGKTPDFYSYVHFKVLEPVLHEMPHIYTYRSKKHYSKTEEADLMSAMKDVIRTIADSIKAKYKKNIPSLDGVLAKCGKNH